MASKKNPRTKKQRPSMSNATPPPPVLEGPKPPQLFVNHERILHRYPELRRLFLDHLATYGNIHAACVYIKVSQHTLERFRDDNPWFAKEMETAQKSHKALIEETIHTRAIDGWLEPKFGKFGITGYVRKYSDQLLIAYARRHIKDYREGDVQTTKVEGTVDHVHSVKVAELTAEQRSALRLLLGPPEGEEIKDATPKLTVEPAKNGHAPSTNGVHKNGTH